MTHMTPGTFQRVRQSLFRRAMRRRVLKLKVDTLSICFNIQEAVIRHPRFRRPRFIELFFFCIVVEILLLLVEPFGFLFILYSL